MAKPKGVRWGQLREIDRRVRIIKRGKRGKIEIEFYSDEELERFYGILMTAERGQ